MLGGQTAKRLYRRSSLVTDRASFNLQIFACFCFALITCIRSVRGIPLPEVKLPEFWFRAGLPCILVLTSFANLPSLPDPLLSDDYIFIHAPANCAALLKSFVKPSGDGAMRPVGELVFGTFGFWAGENPIKWHLLGLTLHLINTWLIYWLCRRLQLSTYVSVVACALFALHPAHPESVAWASSTFDLLAALFSLLTLITLTFESISASIAAPILTAIAILSKESAYTIPFIAMLVLPNRRKGAYVCALVATALFVHRWQVFGGPGGYLNSSTGHEQILSVTP